jgi:AraC-like DNA-binding protein
MVFGQHLILQELVLAPAAEQLPAFDGWLMARVAEGVGYWLEPDSSPTQLNPGDGFVASLEVAGRVRASQLDPVKLQYFTIQPYDLEGLLTVVEWHRLEVARRKHAVPVRFFKHTDAIGQKFSRLTGLAHTEQLPLRCALLQLWAAATTDFSVEDPDHVNEGNKLRARFWQLLSRMTRMELCFSAPQELALRINCSERHFRGLFRKEFGVSMHAYQSALRVNFDLALPREVAAKPCRPRRSTRHFAVPDAQVEPGFDREEINQAATGGPLVRSQKRHGPRKAKAARPG